MYVQTLTDDTLFLLGGGFYSISQPHRFLLHKRVVFEGGVYQSMKMSELVELISPTM